MQEMAQNFYQCNVLVNLFQECNQADEDDRPDLIWWKCKKWSLHILTRCFERLVNVPSHLKGTDFLYEDFLFLANIA